jgi:hypothetical protein
VAESVDDAGDDRQRSTDQGDDRALPGRSREYASVSSTAMATGITPLAR